MSDPVDIDAAWSALRDTRASADAPIDVADDEAEPTVKRTRSTNSADAPPAKRARTATYKKLHAIIDRTLFEHGIVTLLHLAHAEAELRYDETRRPTDAIGRLLPAAFRPNELCASACTAEQVPIALFLVAVDTDEALAQRARDAQHMFLSADSTTAAGRLGVLTTLACASSVVHVCSAYCPYALGARHPEWFASADDAVEPDAFWNSARWHQTPLTHIRDVPTTVYRCRTHNRFHVCGSVCEYMFDGVAGVKTCPISQRVVSDDATHTFGDGVGTAEQREKTAEAKGRSDDNEHRRRSMLAARTRLYETATVLVNGVRVRRSAGVRAATSALRRKAGKAKKVTPEDQQERVVTTASSAEVASCRPMSHRSTAPEPSMTISAIAQVPFSERVPKFDHQFAIDRLHAMLHRVDRRAAFALSPAISRQVRPSGTRRPP